MAFECPNCHGTRSMRTRDVLRDDFERCLDCGYPPEPSQADLDKALETTSAHRAPERAVKPRAKRK